MSQILHAPAAERNRGPILDVLRRVLPPAGSVLEVASGTGQHVEHFARTLTGLQWLPSDPDPAQRASIDARVAAAELANVEPARDLDVLSPWPPLAVAAVVAVNLLHVSPPETVAALCCGAAGVLRPGGALAVYGPFVRRGEHTSPGNRAFHQSLSAQHPGWGIRALETLVDAATDAGLARLEVVEMPANNLLVIFRKPGAVPPDA